MNLNIRVFQLSMTELDKYLIRFNCDLLRCIGGFLQFVNGEGLEYRPNEMALCGANKRYSPPVVAFRDFVQPEHIVGTEMDDAQSRSSNNKKKVAMLLFKVEETTSQSQFLAHYSFTPIGKTPEGTAFHIRGGTVRPHINTTLLDSPDEENFEDTYSSGKSQRFHS